MDKIWFKKMMDFNRYVFGPELMKTNVDLELCVELLKVGKSEMLIDEKLDSITFGASYNFNSSNVDYFKHKIIPYIEEYLKEVRNVRKLPQFNFKYHLEDLWINFQKSRDFNSPHTHASDLSFVIYIDIPEKIKTEKNIKRGFQNGSITFMYGQNLKKYDRNSTEFINVLNSYISPITQVSHLPTTGEMFIFPSYLNHYVSPFFSNDVERISVAGNINLVDGNIKNLL